MSGVRWHSAFVYVGAGAGDYGGEWRCVIDQAMPRREVIGWVDANYPRTPARVFAGKEPGRLVWERVKAGDQS